MHVFIKIYLLKGCLGAGEMAQRVRSRVQIPSTHIQNWEWPCALVIPAFGGGEDSREGRSQVCSLPCCGKNSQSPCRNGLRQQ